MQARLSAGEISKLTRALYTQGNIARRWMVHLRPYICPFEEVIARVPERASVLDVGCGDGLFLNVLGQLQVTSKSLGFDQNQIAIESARTAKNNQPTEDIEFRVWSTNEAWPDGLFDIVSMIDVLHHISPAQKQFAIEEAVRHVKPGGLFLFKDIGASPKWRAWFNSLHDYVLTRERVTYTVLDTVAAWALPFEMEETERQTINRLWYGHELLVLKRQSD